MLWVSLIKQPYASLRRRWGSSHVASSSPTPIRLHWAPQSLNGGPVARVISAAGFQKSEKKWRKLSSIGRKLHKQIAHLDIHSKKKKELKWFEMCMFMAVSQENMPNLDRSWNLLWITIKFPTKPGTKDWRMFKFPSSKSLKKNAVIFNFQSFNHHFSALQVWSFLSPASRLPRELGRESSL